MGAGFAEWTTGLFYYDARQTIAGRKDIDGGLALGGGMAPGVALLEFNDDDVIKSDSKSAFAHLVLHPLENLSVSGGARYTKESKDYTFTRITSGLPFSLGYPGLPFDLAPLNGVTGSYSGDRTDYRFTVDYRWSPDIMTYAQVSTGFKGGGVNPRPFTADQVNPFGPETLTAYEVGLKSDLFAHTVRLNLSAFFNQYDKIQLTALACPTAPCAQPFNAGDAEVKGAELELTVKPIAALLVDASASYLDFEYKSLSPNTAGITLGMITPYTPKQKYSAGAQYEFVLGSAGSLTPRVDWSHQSKMYTNPVNGPTNLVNGYGLLNARLTWRDSNDTWEAALFATNLTNKFYYLNKFDLGVGPPFFVVNGQPGAPREWGVTLKRKF
jgi:iron complex outermembrane recepter protein